MREAGPPWLIFASQEDFAAAAEEIKGYNVKSDDDLLELYALYKQANVGDNTTGEGASAWTLTACVTHACKQSLPCGCEPCTCLHRPQPSQACWTSRASRSGMHGRRRKVCDHPASNTESLQAANKDPSCVLLVS